MSMNVHVTMEHEYLARGYVRVGEPSETGRVDMADPERTCLRSLRTGPCRMRKDHRGRCTTVVFYCDVCDQARRGVPAAHDTDSNGDTTAVACWFCMNVDTYAARSKRKVDV